MQRTYLALVGLGLAASGLQPLGAPLARAAGVFSSQPLDASRFVVLGKPVGEADWTLLVLEQVAAQPRCWESRPDGLVDPTLNRFDFTGICNRYIDSNGFSLRIEDQDLASTYRLRLRQVGQELQLQAMSPQETTTLLVGRGRVNLRDRNGFVALTLEPDWQLSRRVFGQQALSHLYFANATPLAQLLARAGGRPAIPPTASPLQPFPEETIARGGGEASGPVALQVVPFQE